MADTDDESVTFARDAEKSAGAIALDPTSLAAGLQNALAKKGFAATR